MASETIKAATDEEIANLRANGEAQYWQADVDKLKARIDADRQLIEQLVAALEKAELAHTLAFVHGQPLMFKDGTPFDHRPMNEMAEMARAALQKARATGVGKPK